MNVSKFLKVDLFTNTKQNRAQCEVIAYGTQKGTDKDKNKDKKSFELSKGCKEFQALFKSLQNSSELAGGPGSSCIVRFANVKNASHTLFTSLGKDKSGINKLGARERLRRIAAQIGARLNTEKVKSAVVYLDTFLIKSGQIGLNLEEATYVFVEGLGLSQYQFKNYFSSKSSKKDEDPIELYITLTSSPTNNQKKSMQAGLLKAIACIRGTELCRDLGNEPSNVLNPVEYAKRAQNLAKDLGLKATVLDEKILAKEKMGLLLGVGQGSVIPPRMILLEYNPKNANKKTKTVAFVGKGITFDSGGISIKPSARMEEMKFDMCGSAAVIGAITTVAALKLNVRVITIVAAAENMPDGGAINPGNILTARNGKTVEVVNTDAEGRLVLADALDYVQDKNPDYIIDLATLTGAATITVGKACSVLFGNSERFTKLVKKAADLSGERVWEMPMFDEYFDELKSDYADMRNVGDGPAAGSAKGAMFLEQFIRPKTEWVHLDIATMMNGLSHLPYCPKRSGSGYGVRLLVELATLLEK